MTNETYHITVQSPLLRPGLRIETTCSGKYLHRVLENVMGAVRQYNKGISINDLKPDKYAPGGKEWNG